MTSIRFNSVLLAGAAALASVSVSYAQNADEFVGKWMTAAGDGVISLDRCSLGKDLPNTALCGVVVWDAEVKNPKRTAPLDCNRKVVEYSKFEGNAWAKGWAFDPRTNKTYNSKIRLKDGKIHARSYLASEMFGETEIWTRVTTVPPGCDEKKPEPSKITGSGNN